LVVDWCAGLYSTSVENDEDARECSIAGVHPITEVTRKVSPATIEVRMFERELSNRRQFSRAIFDAEKLERVAVPVVGLDYDSRHTLQ
jgi:hypothetical protein